ncbi:glutamate cyclase domain-containing protein [Mariprofundus ferrooxydans]|nr:glutamate cyclase domain-containing protein [Mariprofundus ferrooxydans]
MNTKEKVLQHGSRGMDILKDYVDEDIYVRCANRLVDDERKVALITTGFFVANSAETDGPPGAFFLYHALKKIGYEVALLVDPIVFPLMCNAVGYESLINMPLGEDVDSKAFARSIRDSLNPSVIIAIERCGRAADGKYKNMRGKDIGAHTAKVDEVFELLASESYSVGIGDGGNEIGMGNLVEVIHEGLDIDPCIVPVDELLIATVSNWGAYGLIRELEIASSRSGLLPTPEQQQAFVAKIVGMGAVNGMSGLPECVVDGFDAEVEQSIVASLI